MSEAKHTPGPWQQYANGSQVYGSDGLFITSVQSKKPVDDARLIAAAPELLEALKLVRQSTEWSCMEATTQNAVDAAIAKATGAAND